MNRVGTLDRVQLGTTDMRITRIGLGAWAMGGSGWVGAWGRQDDEDSIAAIRHAVASGVNWIDTAPSYGLGHSEEVVARALRYIPFDERPYVFTKCGVAWRDQDRMGALRMVCSRESIVRELDDSLRRLRLERIDLYQVHWPPDDGTSIDEYWGTLAELRTRGKIRAIGLSNHDVRLLARAERLAHVDAIQPRFSAIFRQAAASEIPWCCKNKTGVVVYSPMHAGLLSGAFNAGRILGSDDWRIRDPEFNGDSLKRNLQLVDALKAVAIRHETTVASIAIAWTLAWPGVTGAIVGARGPHQVDDWLDAGALILETPDLEVIAASIGAIGVGSGPVRPEDSE